MVEGVYLLVKKLLLPLQKALVDYRWSRDLVLLESAAIDVDLHAGVCRAICAGNLDASGQLAAFCRIHRDLLR